MSAPTLCGIGAILLWALLALSATQLSRLPPIEITALGFAGAGPLATAFFLWDVGMNRGDVRLIGALAYATPVLSALVLMLAGAAPFSWTIVLAAALVAGGGLLAMR